MFRRSLSFGLLLFLFVGFSSAPVDAQNKKKSNFSHSLGDSGGAQDLGLLNRRLCRRNCIQALETLKNDLSSTTNLASLQVTCKWGERQIDLPGIVETPTANNIDSSIASAEVTDPTPADIRVEPALAGAGAVEDPILADGANALAERAKKLKKGNIGSQIQKRRNRILEDSSLSEEQKANFLAQLDEISALKVSRATDGNGLTTSEHNSLMARLKNLDAEVDRANGGDGIQHRIRALEKKLQASASGSRLSSEEHKSLKKKLNKIKEDHQAALKDGLSDEEKDAINSSLDTVSDDLTLANNNQQSLRDLLAAKKKALKELNKAGRFSKTQLEAALEDIGAIEEKLNRYKDASEGEGLTREQRLEIIREANAVMSAANILRGEQIKDRCKPGEQLFNIAAGTTEEDGVPVFRLEPRCIKKSDIPKGELEACYVTAVIPQPTCPGGLEYLRLGSGCQHACESTTRAAKLRKWMKKK